MHPEGKINELNQGFSIENDCLTPTFKLKRPNLLKLYKTEIDFDVRLCSARTRRFDSRERICDRVCSETRQRCVCVQCASERALVGRRRGLARG